MHFIQIQSAAPSFMGIWAIRSPLKIHCYTCMSFETCWSRLIYTKLSSHRSFVINMYVVTMAWRCIPPWRFHRSLQRRRQIDIFHICQDISTFWSKNNQKKEENFDWTVVNTENLKSNPVASNLNDIGIPLQIADSGSYHFLVTVNKIFRIIWKLSENC